MSKTVNKIIKSGEYPQVLLLFGEEEFLLEESYHKLVNSLLKESGADYDTEILDAGETGQDRIVDSCSAYPFVSPRRNVIVKNFDKLFSGKVSKKTKESSPIARYFASPQPTTFLLLIANDDKLKGLGAAKEKAASDKNALKKIRSAKFPYNIILENFEAIEFPKVYESRFGDWINSRLKNTGKKISPEALEFLVTNTNPTLRSLNNELEKLLLHIGDRDEIKLDDVKFISGASRDYNVFELQKAVGARNLKRSLEILENMLAADRAEMLIMTIIARYFNILWKLIDIAGSTSNNYEIASKIGVSSYFVGEYMASLKRYSPSEIENALIFLTDADETLKSSSTDPLSVLTNLFVKIMDKHK